MSTATTQQLTLIGDIVEILYRNNSFWAKCGGAQGRPGVSESDLLPQLQAIDSVWDSTLLTSMLRLGLRIGALRQQKIGPATCLFDQEAAPAYWINNNMLYENNVNYFFQQIIPGLPAPGL